MKNRLQCLLLVLCLVVGLVACAKAPTWQEQYDLGVRYLSEGNYEEAIIAFTAAINIDPKQETAYLGLADAYIGTGDYEQARKVLEDAQEKLGERQTLEDKLAEIEELESSNDKIDVSAEVTGSIHAEGLSVQVHDSRTATITIDGLALQDSYTVNKSTSKKDMTEYSWEVHMYNSYGHYAVSTSCWAFDPGKDEQKSLAEMQHTLWIFRQDADTGYTHGEYVVPVSMSHTANSISWTFSVPVEYSFDFADVNRYERWLLRENTDEIIKKEYLVN